MAIRGLCLVALLSVSVLAALTLTTTAAALRGGTPEDGLPTSTTISTTGTSTSAARTRIVASRRSLATSPKASDKKSLKKKCADLAGNCLKMAANMLTGKNVAKMAVNHAVPGSATAITAMEGLAAARKGDKEAAKEAAKSVAKAVVSTAAGAVAGPHGTLAFKAGAAAAEHVKPIVDEKLAKRKAEKEEERWGSGMIVQEEGA
ncbi:unnamed protein product [Closterium sp. Naga37s-1]|nr:unnamed protein product [Closterium sp. Naga37s-1]